MAKLQQNLIPRTLGQALSDCRTIRSEQRRLGNPLIPARITSFGGLA